MLACLQVSLVQKAKDLQGELEEETAFEAKLVAEAERFVSNAMDSMFQ